MIRLLAALALAGLTAGCFQPLYGTQSPIGGKAGVGDKMSAVEVAPIAAPNGTRLSRIGVNVRNELMYQFTGGGPADRTMVIGISIYRTAFRYYDMGVASALSWMLVLVSVVLTVLYLRLFSREGGRG